MKTFSLKILTSTGIYLETEASFLEVRSERYNLGILPFHSPLISSVDISIVKRTSDGITKKYATSGGVIKIKDNVVTLLLDSIESEEEIDKERAKSSKERAIERLNSQDKDIDIIRAKASLARALNRLNLLGID